MAQVGTVEVIAKIDTSQYKKGANEIERANSKIEGDTSNTSSKMNKYFSGVAKVGIAAIATAAVAAGAMIVKNLGGAMNRIDTLVAFPRVLQSLGVASDDAESATDRLAESLKGLPTALGDGAKGVQGLVTSGLDVDKATRAFLGFNNAMLAASVETGAAQSTMQQLNQALSRGRIDGQEWNSIAANIPTVMQALQNETGKSKDELRELFREDPQALLDNIIRLNEKGGGGLVSLEEQARAATGGIGTAFANLDNSIQRGIQNIVTNLGGGDLETGQRKISDFISNIGKAFGDGLESIGNGLSFAVTAIQKVIQWLQPLINYVKENQTLMEVLKTTLIVLGGLLLGVVLGGIVAVIGVITVLTGAVEVTVKTFSWLMSTAVKVFNVIYQSAYSAVSSIKNIFGSLFVWFSNLWNRISRLFRSVGTTIGNAIGNSFRGVINGILRWAIGKINGFIASINDVVGIINKLPGVNIGRIGSLPIPQLATGGIVTSATLAMIGEGSEPEAVIPLSKLDKMINGDTTSTDNSKIEINVSGVFATSKQEQRNVAELIATRLKEVQKSRALNGSTS